MTAEEQIEKQEHLGKTGYDGTLITPGIVSFLFGLMGTCTGNSTADASYTSTVCTAGRIWNRQLSTSLTLLKDGNTPVRSAFLRSTITQTQSGIISNTNGSG